MLLVVFLPLSLRMTARTTTGLPTLKWVGLLPDPVACLVPVRAIVQPHFNMVQTAGIS